MRCPNCDHENDHQARFCINCGAEIAPTCPNCGSPVTPDQNFCGTCGFKLNPEAAARIGQASPASYTPSHLASRILADRHLIVGERKRVTVMFADIVGSTATIEQADPEEAAEFLTDALGAMMDAVHHYEGTVNELLGDGIVALFGAPIAHEDHAVRACRAALEIPAEVSRATSGMAQTRVGLHSGEVLVRAIGTDLSVEYQAIGPTVHLASRMEQLAKPGTTFVTASTHRLAEGFIEAKPAGHHDVKGISEPVEVFELVAAPVVTAWEARAARGLTTFVGREGELATLEAAMKRVELGSGRAVVVVGEAGVGKSRLVHEFLAGRQSSEVLILRCGASPFDQSTAYYPIKRLVHDWLDSRPNDEDLVDRLATELGTVDPELLPALPALAALIDREPPNGAWDELSPEERRQQTRNGLRALLLGLAARRPLVVVVEDLHWIDGETQRVLDDLVDVAGGSALMLLATCRPEYENKWGTKTHYTTLHLESLTEPMILEFLDTMLGVDPSLDMLKPHLAARSDGTPLFLEESMRTLVETGYLVGEIGNYRAKRRDLPEEIPDGVQAVLAARVDRLEPGDKEVLQVASVIGELVPLPLLAQVADVPDEELLRTLAELQTRAFLHEQRVLPTPEYSFKHALTRDVVYSSLPRARRLALHGRLVESLESESKESRENVIERLAYHALEAELWPRAADYALAAGNKAIDKSAYREASRFLREAIRAIGELPQGHETIQRAIDVRLRLRVAETGSIGGLARVIQDLLEAEQLAISINDRPRLLNTLIHQGYVANMQGDSRFAVKQGKRALELALEMDDGYLVAEARLVLAQTYDYAGRPLKVADLLLPDLELRAGPSRHQRRGQTMVRSVVAYGHLAWSSAFLGHFADSAEYEEAGSRIATEAGRPFDQLYMRAVAGIRWALQGEAEQAVTEHERAAEIGDEHDLWFIRTFFQPWRGHALLGAGRPAEALALLVTTQEAAELMELPYVRGLSLVFAAEARRMLGESKTSMSEAEEALEFANDRELPLIELAALTTLGKLKSSDEESSTFLEKAIEVAGRQGMRPWLAELSMDRADMLRSNHRADEAVALYRSAAQEFSAMGMDRRASQAESEIPA